MQYFTLLFKYLDYGEIIMKYFKRICIFIILIFALALGCSCSNNVQISTTISDKPVVTVSIPPQSTFVEKVCGDLVDVITMIPPGGNPANYEPTPMQKENFIRFWVLDY